jgi:hypothetical protein
MRRFASWSYGVARLLVGLQPAPTLPFRFPHEFTLFKTARVVLTIVLLVNLLVLGGCKTTNDIQKTPTAAIEPPPPPPPPTALLLSRSALVADLDASTTAPNLLKITPFSDLSPPVSWQSIPTTPYSDAYTRLLITSVTGGSGPSAPQTLNYNQRNWFQRFFLGIHSSTNLTVKVSAGSYTATVPLVSIDHVSTKSDGEVFNRILYQQAENYPLFLVKGDGSNEIVSLKATVKISDQIQSGVAGAALQVAQTAIKNVAPQTAVLTALSQKGADNKANALDAAVDKLFAASVDEEQWSDGDIRAWKEGVTITFRIPTSDGSLEPNPIPVGTWTVHFAPPRPSIFLDVDLCPKSHSAAVGDRCASSMQAAAEAAEQEAQPTDVLQFQLLDSGNSLGTVETYIKKQDWYTNGIRQFAGKPTQPQAADFCRSLKSSVAALNLNSVDQGIIAHAAVAAMSIPDPGYQLLRKESQCACKYSKCAALPDVGS